METYKQLGIEIQSMRQAMVAPGTAEVDRDRIRKGPGMSCQGRALQTAVESWQSSGEYEQVCILESSVAAVYRMNGEGSL